MAERGWFRVMKASTALAVWLGGSWLAYSLHEQGHEGASIAVFATGVLAFAALLISMFRRL
jgi:hypothetical protein